MSQGQENITLEPQLGPDDSCIHCDHRENIQLWMPRQVLDYLNSVYGGQKADSEIQYMLLRCVQANLEDLSEYSPKASYLSRKITRIIDEINDG